ncbi:MAG TPA: NifU family protein [Fimbriimonadaceae bacterium]|nr:NifU family protein [Fimbriimonadaceae bacterium]HRJ32262.1 NifU family protein [Fimbriimonadaceae bacterium]
MWIAPAPDQQAMNGFLRRLWSRTPPPPRGSGPLFEAIIAALAEVQDYARSHGGEIVLVEVTDQNVVKVRFQGACAGCPLAGVTFRLGIEKELMSRFPEIRKVQLLL